MRIRKAEPADAKQFISIKNKLQLALHDGVNHQGGFLLGTSEETYTFFIENCICYVAEAHGEIKGFGIALPDLFLRTCELWSKRKSVAWKTDISVFEDQQLAYIEQLAFLPSNKLSAVYLAHMLMENIFATGVKAIFTTTVRKPVTNLAAVPLIIAGGGLYAGNIDEYYPAYGFINSDIYLISADAYYASIKNKSIIEKLQNSQNKTEIFPWNY